MIKPYQVQAGTARLPSIATVVLQKFQIQLCLAGRHLCFLDNRLSSEMVGLRHILLPA